MQPAVDAPRWERCLRRFRRNKDGAIAIEFAAVAAPLFAIIFAIMETGLVFLAGRVLDTGVYEGARLIRTGQAQSAGFDVGEFRTRVCDRLGGLFNCDDLKFDVRTYPNFSSITLTPPVNEDGEVEEDDFAFELGGGGEVMVVRVFYEWPIVVPYFGNDMSNLANGRRLLASASTFRNEPF